MLLAGVLDYPRCHATGESCAGVAGPGGATPKPHTAMTDHRCRQFAAVSGTLVLALLVAYRISARTGRRPQTATALSLDRFQATSVSRHIATPPDIVFELITDPGRLPQWNGRIRQVLERPATLEVGSQWVVEMNVMGTRFPSRSTVLELDRARGRFAHRSKRDDANPSHTVWTWEVASEGTGSRVTLAWDLRGLTLGRRLLAIPIRSRQIPTEAATSLAALGKLCEQSQYAC